MLAIIFIIILFYFWSCLLRKEEKKESTFSAALLPLALTLSAGCHEPLQPCACRQVAACHSPTDGHTTVSGPRQTACLLLGTLARLELLQPPGSVMPGARIGAFCLNTEKLSFHGLFPETLMKPGAQFQGPGICACGLLPLVFPSRPKCPQRAPLWSYC